MAGIIAAATDNGSGIAGIGYDGVKVMPVTVLDADGHGQDSDIIEGIVWAVDHGADVINMSFSNPGFSAALQAAIDYAWADDVVVVAATGNDGSCARDLPGRRPRRRRRLEHRPEPTRSTRRRTTAPTCSLPPPAPTSRPSLPAAAHLGHRHVGVVGRGRGGGRPAARHRPVGLQRRHRRPPRPVRGRRPARAPRPATAGSTWPAPSPTTATDRSSRRAPRRGDGGPFVGPYVAAAVAVNTRRRSTGRRARPVAAGRLDLDHHGRADDGRPARRTTGTRRAGRSPHRRLRPRRPVSTTRTTTGTAPTRETFPITAPGRRRDLQPVPVPTTATRAPPARRPVHAVRRARGRADNTRSHRHDQPGARPGRPDQRQPDQLHGRVQRGGHRLRHRRRHLHRHAPAAPRPAPSPARARPTTSRSPA